MVRQIRRDEEPPLFELPNALVDLQLAIAIHRDMHADVDGGFYVGELNGEVIASSVESWIADDLKFHGHLQVVDKYRSSGFARRILATIDDVGKRRKWAGIDCFDAYQNLERMFKTFDLKTSHKMICYEGTVSTSASRNRFGTDIREVTSLTRANLIRLFI